MFVEEKKQQAALQLGDCFLKPLSSFSFSLLLPSRLLPTCTLWDDRNVGSRIVARLEFGGFGWSFLPSCDRWGLWEL